MVPMILGFDPRYQFAHEDDVVHALEHCAFNDLEGTYNVAADGVLALSEMIGLLGKRYLPILPPLGTGLVVGPLRRLGVRVAGRDAQPAALRPRPRQSQAEGDRLSLPVHLAGGRSEPGGEHAPAPGAGGANEPYRYEREVEEFLRWSPNVAPRRAGRAPKGRRTGRARASGRRQPRLTAIGNSLVCRLHWGSAICPPGSVLTLCVRT